MRCVTTGVSALAGARGSAWPYPRGVAANVAHFRVESRGQESLRNPLDQADRDGVSGNSGLNPTAGAPPPAWSGFRPLRVTDVMTESDSVFSAILTDPDASPLPSWLAGQSIALTIRLDQIPIMPRRNAPNVDLRQFPFSVRTFRPSPAVCDDVISPVGDG